MEFDIGTLIYILITIVAIAASVLGKKKKPVDGEAASDGESGPFGFISKLEEQIGGSVDEIKDEVQPVADEVIATEKPDYDRIQQDQGGYDWQSASFEGDSAISGNYYNEFEGFYDADKKENLESIIEEAEKSTSEENLEVIDMDDFTNPDYFEIAKDFDLGTAVIYSTIINRKEY